jgi:hypothetical protein
MRARALLQDIFGEIRLVDAGEELYAEFEGHANQLAPGTLVTLLCEERM